MATFLEQITASEISLDSLSKEELQTLASEIRSVLVDTVSHTGGHLASNLGVVELTIALNLALDIPKDKIIWDVGHQCYTHKILNGRMDRFNTLRQQGGISGFPNPDEDPSDVFLTGHASTSIAAACGLAKGRDLKGMDNKIVAVIGDGAMTGGLAFEGLNNIELSKSGIVVILNDNEMSISSNVGGLANLLGTLRTHPKSRRFQLSVETALRRIPLIGKGLLAIFNKIKSIIKSLVISQRMYFEEMGLVYKGPVDGHDIKQVKRAIDLAIKADRPVLIHVLTKKGMGYPPAIRRPDLFHGVSEFDKDNGDIKKNGKRTYTDVFSETICEMAKSNENIVAITAAMMDGTGLSEFSVAYPDRIFDVGIAEQFATTFAAGLATSGIVPIFAVYSTFLQRAYDQIVHDVATQNLKVIFAIDRAGIVGQDGVTHQGVFDIAYLSKIPNMTILAPKDGKELKAMMNFALNVDGPVAIRYPKESVEEIPSFVPIELGVAELLRDGADCAILALGSMVKCSLLAAEILDKQNISAAVVNARFAKPIDCDMIKDVCSKHKIIVTVEEGVKSGGFGSMVLDCMEEMGITDKPCVIRLGVPDKFVEHGKRQDILSGLGLDAEGIAEAIAAHFDQRV